MADDVRQRILLELEANTRPAEAGLKKFEAQSTSFFSRLAKNAGGAFTGLNQAAELSSKVIRGVSAAFDLAGESARRSGSTAANEYIKAYDQMNASTRRFVDALGTALIPVMTQLAKVIGTIADAMTELSRNQFEVLALAQEQAGALQRGGLARQAGRGFVERSAQIAVVTDSLRQVNETFVLELFKQYAAEADRTVRRIQLAAAPRGGAGAGRVGSVPVGAGAGAGAATAITSSLKRFSGPSDADLQQGFDAVFTRDAESRAASVERFRAAAESARPTEEAVARISAQIQAAAAPAQKSAGKTLLEGIFGTNEQIEAQAKAFGAWGGALASATDVGRAGFEVMGQAVGGAVDALITGQEGVGKALKRAVAEGLRAVAIQMSIDALKNTALGIAALALGNPQAGGFFAAAAASGAAALAAGAGARALGAGQSGPPPTTGVGAGSAVSSLGRSAGSAGSNVTVVVGSDFADDSPRVRRHKLARAINQARTATGSDTIDFS